MLNEQRFGNKGWFHYSKSKKHCPLGAKWAISNTKGWFHHVKKNKK
jgi:hypothetical protein